MSNMILHFITDNATGGAQRLVADILDNTAGQSVLFFKQRKNGILFKESKIVFMPSFRSLRSLMRVIKLYRQITLVHVHLFPCLYLAIIFFPFKKKIFTEHSSRNGRSENKFWRAFDVKVYGSYEKIIAISNSVKEALI